MVSMSIFGLLSRRTFAFFWLFVPLVFATCSTMATPVPPDGPLVSQQDPKFKAPNKTLADAVVLARAHAVSWAVPCDYSCADLCHTY